MHAFFSNTLNQMTPITRKAPSIDWCFKWNMQFKHASVKKGLVKNINNIT